jgi:glycosyltransferase involved in cell wall biosynthesis
MEFPGPRGVVSSMRKAVYVGFKFTHMGSHTGYDSVRLHAKYDLFVDCEKDYERMQRFLARRTLLSRSYGRVLGSRLWWVEIRCLFLALLHRDLVFHFVYAENTYRYLGWFKWLGFRIVCTYHQPVSFYRKRPKFLRGMQRVDDIIVLSAEAVCPFQAWKGDEKVHAIDHGVDTDFFYPDAVTPHERQVLTVGNWMRDFEFAARVFAVLLQHDENVQVHVIANKDNLGGFHPHPRLHLHHGITDEELLSRYRSAALLFLPLHDFVACNAVLEAAAVGLPILVASTRKGDQLPDGLIEYLPMELDVVVRRIREHLEESDPFERRRRDWVVQHLSWPVIGRETARIIRNC